MTLCIEVSDTGVLSAVSDDMASCTQYVLVSASDYKTWFELIGLSPADMATAFGGGFAIILTMYLTAYAISVGKTLIRKV